MKQQSDYTIHKKLFINNELKKSWLRSECQEEVTPYLYYNYMKYVFWQTVFLSPWIPCIYFITDKNNKIVFIAPMRKHMFTGVIDTLGNVSYCDITDFLYDKDLSKEDRKRCVSLLRKKIGKSFKLSRIVEDSHTISYLGNEFQITEVARCVNIKVESDYDSHIASLSKSVRQNIRTANNRLIKNHQFIELKYFEDASTFTKIIIKDAKRIYLKRQKETYSQGINFIKKIKHLLVVKLLRHDNFSLYKSKNAITASLYLNNEIAAFFSGLINKRKDRIVIPRLAIDEKFKFYSPGYLLLCETIKYLIMNNSSIKNIDLCRGTEKYKTDLGGQFIIHCF